MRAIYVTLSFLLIFSLVLVGCSSRRTIVNGVEERDANEILVLLNNKNINAIKVQSSQGGGSGANKIVLWDIEVPNDKAIEAMNYLDEEGLPRRHSEDLLQIFSNTGLVPSAAQEKIRYEAGLAQQIAGTIKEIDGVLDANVIISFPERNPFTGKTNQPITASVYVKHNGVLDDPNLHLISKIKRLVSASVTGLSYDNVTVVGDRAQSSEIPIGMQASQARQWVDVWSIILDKESSFRFRLIFFTLLFSNLILAIVIIFIFWKIHPLIVERGWSSILSAAQIKELDIEKKTPIETPPSEQTAPSPDKDHGKDKEFDDI